MCVRVCLQFTVQYLRCVYVCVCVCVCVCALLVVLCALQCALLCCTHYNMPCLCVCVCVLSLLSCVPCNVPYYAVRTTCLACMCVCVCVHRFSTGDAGVYIGCQDLFLSEVSGRFEVRCRRVSARDALQTLSLFACYTFH